MHRAALLLLLPPLLLACDDDDTNKDTGPADDTATPIVYDEGCILVDGAGGYAWLNDAITVAQEGATIEVCAGSYEEAVVVDKPVHIVGAGADLTLWDAPTNTAAFTFTAVSGASLSGFTIASTRSGIELQDTSQVDLSDLSISDVGNYGIQSKDSSAVTIVDSLFSNDQWGAVLVDGGDLAVADSTFSYNPGFAVKATSDADIDVSGCDIFGTTYTEIVDGGIADGFPIFGDEAGDISLSGNTLYDNPVLSIFVTNTDNLSLSGDTLEGGLYGVYQVYGDLTLQDVTITDPTEFGVYWVAPVGESFYADGLTVSGDPDVVSDYDWDDPDYFGSVGLFLAGDDMTLNDTTVSGYNNYGGYLATYAGGGLLEMDNVLFQDNGRHGLYTEALDTTATDVTIEGVRELDDGYDGATYIDLPAAWFIAEGNLDLVGGSVSDSAGWGISSSSANISVAGVSFSNNGRAAVMDFYGSSVLSGNTFTASASGESFGTVCAYDNAGMVLEGNQFIDNINTVVYDYSDSYGYPYWQIYYNNGLDVYGYEGKVTAYGNTFQGGDQSFLLYYSDAEIYENTWTDYNYNIVYSYNYGSAGSLSFHDSTVDGFGGYLLSSSYGDAELEDVTAINGTTYSRHYETWENEVLTSESEYSSYANTIYTSNGTLQVEDVTLQDIYAAPLYSYESSVDIDGLEMTNVATGTSSSAMTFYWFSSTVEVYIENLLLDTAGSSQGLYLYQSTGVPFSAVSVTDSEISGVAGSAIYLGYLEAAELSELELHDNSGDAMDCSSATFTLTESTLEDNGGHGLDTSTCFATVSSTTLSANLGDGAEIYGGMVNISDCVLSGNQGTGLDLQSTTASATDNEITDNSGYGMSCDGSVIIRRCGNTVSGNLLGDNNGCDASCVLGDPDPGGDTGDPGSDTGGPADTGVE